MHKTLDIILVVIMLAAATWTFGVKHEAESIEERLRVVERDIAMERDTISLLEADWSLLNQPYRLQRLADTFAEELQLKPIVPRQIVTPADLPSEPVPVVPEEPLATGNLAANAAGVLR
ncbi:cell division protein FtsL [Aureimonas frigidaquae]|uniref:cell division protein FtsL n=1 Tax=Aureimonas frigidaquae TaxID=424757 RepID=UPI000783EA2E|nr:hypothetical protein [Aureimonas frigidaquae]